MHAGLLQALKESKDAATPAKAKSASQHSEEAKRTITGTTNTSEEQTTVAQAEHHQLVVDAKPSDMNLAAELNDEHDCGSGDDDGPQDGDEEAFEVDSINEEENADELEEEADEETEHENSVRRRDMSQ